jgi:hypothetical protein
MSPLEDEVKRIVIAVLAELGVTPLKGEVYDRDHLPPGFRSREAFAGECRRLGFDRVVYRAGRNWSVPREVWDRSRFEDRTRRLGPRDAPERLADVLDATLERAGLRLVRPGGSR